MRNKGFTLIELLAVIVILAIIALIALPIILGIINTAREESNKRSVELYANAVRNAIAVYQLTNPNAPTIFSDLDVEYDGDVECTIKELYKDGSFYLEGCKVNKSENEYSYGAKKEGAITDNNKRKPCTLEDKDGDGEASLSDVVTCGTESFYVMTNENNEITMLSMHNLYVGYVDYSDRLDYDSVGDIILLENATNKQSELAKGKMYSVHFGVVDFSSTHYWESSISEYPAYVYNENSNLYQYVSEYERILKEELKVNSATARLISLEQLEELGCDLELMSCYYDNTAYGRLETPSWVFSTTYWTGSVYHRSHRLMCVTQNGYLDPWPDNNGIRPVIKISIDEI